MKLISTWLLFFSMISLGFAQNKEMNRPEYLHKNVNHTWYTPDEKAPVKTADYLKKVNQDFLHPDLNSLHLISDITDQQKIRHRKIQHYFHGIEVLGGEMFIHSENDRVLSVNGNVNSNFDLAVPEQITKNQAIQYALARVPSQKYAWEQDAFQTPDPVLVWMDIAYPEYSGNFRLAYKIDIYSYVPLTKKRIYIDAENGSVLLEHEILTSCFSGGTGDAHTLYHGQRKIETEFTNGQFELLDLTRGAGIETVSATGRKYTDDDNTWEAGSFAQKKGALDVHFGAQVTYDYYKNYFNRKGFDDKDSKLLNKVIDTSFYVNAFWDGAGTNFGIGDSVITNPLTSLDVVSHEITHGLTQHTSGLEYLYESGALNESYSDIVGKAVEFEYDSANFNWLLGSRFFNKPDTAFRSMSEPTRFGNPKNYKGSRWVTNSGDNGGVHSNSGVLNYWFYLLSEGGAGKTEKNVDFDVKKIGIRQAISIVYEAMTLYMGKTSKYYDMRQATLAIAENRYGKCSEEYKNIIEAWVAVGMGARNSDNDIMIVNEKIPQVSCKEGYFPVEVRLLNISCSAVIPAGTEINMHISVPRRNKITELLTLSEDLNPGQSLIYKFTKLPFIERTNITIQIEAEFLGDADTVNNRLPLLISKNNNGEHDFRVTSINTSGSLCEGRIVNAQLVSTYLGCHPVAVGTSIKVQLEYDGKMIEREFLVDRTIYPNANYRTPQFSIDRDFIGHRKVLARLTYSNDTLTANNTAIFNAVFVNNTNIGYLEPFTDQKFDSTLLVVRPDSFQLLEINSNLNSSEALLISGGVIFNAQNRLVPIVTGTIGNMFSSNTKFTTTLYACIQTDNLQKAYLSFDYIQKTGNPLYDSLLTDITRAAVTRVIFRNQDGQSIMNPVYLQNASRTPELRYFEQEIPLTGGPVTIEIGNLVLEGALDSLGFVDQSKDFIMLDNLKIFGEVVKNEDPLTGQELILRPNPVQHKLNISLKRDHREIKEYQIRDAMGKLYQKGILNDDQTELNVSELMPGAYFFELLLTNGATSNYKFVKQ
ncbi:MAG: M4 family metallopeptidase [Saprospiraceae bacterium]|nr:M4 family metallopeptidase [Saprospiraceae bacterium]